MSKLKIKREPFEWLTEESRLFLQRGYLLEGVSAKQRIRQIAEHAEKVLIKQAKGDKKKIEKLKGFADKFYEYMGHGWFSLSSPIWANFALERGADISCVAKDTLIVTSKGNKKAEEIQVGDLLLTHKNRFKKVVKVIPTSQKTGIYKLKVATKEIELYITHDHLVLTNLGWVKVEDLKINEHLIATNDYVDYEKSKIDLKETFKVEFKDGLIYSPIEVLEKTDKVEDVYDFTVEDDHSFSCAGVVVHNCFGSYIHDSINGIMSTTAEVGSMSKIGGGTSGYFGSVRPRGAAIKDNGKSNGSFSFLKLFDTTINVVAQGSSRRGMFAGYTDVEHGDIEEWLDIHTEGNPIQLMHYGICVGNHWLKEMKEGDYQKRLIWSKVLTRKRETGLPYIFFKDNANLNTVDVYKDKNKTIYASNMCTEIMLPSSVDESFVCCLASMNLLHFEEWKNTDAPKVLTYFLDVVMSEFIRKVKNEPYMQKARKFAENHRALGVGVLGWHSYLQSNSIPFDSFEASMKNREIFKLLKEKTYEASKELAELFGEPEILKGYGRRNTTLMAIAPTKSSSFILGEVSQGIEPFKSNYTIKDTAKVKKTWKNPYLIKLLQEKGMDNEEIWESIMIHDGSVQHLSFLSEHEKDVFKTFGEISQLGIIQQAAQRQKYIDQGQSLSIMIHPKTDPKDINKLYMTAAELEIKSIYYQNSINAAQAFNRSLLECSSCEA